jgi:hypothetical protein
METILLAKSHENAETYLNRNISGGFMIYNSEDADYFEEEAKDDDDMFKAEGLKRKHIFFPCTEEESHYFNFRFLTEDFGLLNGDHDFEFEVKGNLIIDGSDYFWALKMPRGKYKIILDIDKSAHYHNYTLSFYKK